MPDKGKEYHMTEIQKEINYKEAYEREHLKSAELAARIAELEEKNDLLEFKLNRIKTNPLWVLLISYQELKFFSTSEHISFSVAVSY